MVEAERNSVVSNEHLCKGSAVFFKHTCALQTERRTVVLKY